MATEAAKRFSVKTDTSVFKRLGRGNQENITRSHQVKNLVCKYWLEGRCTRNPCKFKHPDQAISISKYAWKNPNTLKSENSPPIEKPRTKFSKNKENSNLNQNVHKSQQKLLTNEVNPGQTKSIPKKNSENLHPGFYGKGLSMVTRLEGHTKVNALQVFVFILSSILEHYEPYLTIKTLYQAITGIALPSGSNKLFCSSKDKSLRVWDCNSGQVCLMFLNLFFLL